MERITLTGKNRIYLKDPQITADEYSVTYSIKDQIRTAVKDKEEKDITSRKAAFDNNNAKRYYAEFELDPNMKGDYLNLAFQIYDKDGVMVTSPAYYVDLKIDRQSSAGIVPVSFFKEVVAAGDLDQFFKDRVANYPVHLVESMLQAATGRLESQTKLYFTPQSVESECHDYMGQPLREDWWAVQLFESPVIDVTAYELWYGTKKAFTVKKDFLRIRNIEGVVQFLPSGGQNAVDVYLNNIEFAMLQLFAQGGMLANHVPDVFRVSYTYGLNPVEMQTAEREALMHAIVTKALIDNLPQLKPELQLGSESQSADGVSYSFSQRGLDWLTMQENRLNGYIHDLMRKYNKLVDVVIS